MNYKTVLLAALILSGCKCNSGKDKTVAGDTLLVIPDTLLVYDVDPENKSLQKHTEVPDSAFTAARVVNGLNDKYPTVQIRLLRQSNDTIYVFVPESEYLSQRMGSAGAANWYADAVWNLGSLPGVRYVNIALEEGSHAAPGVFSIGDYPDFKLDTTTKTRGIQ